MLVKSIKISPKKKKSKKRKYRSKRDKIFLKIKKLSIGEIIIQH